MEKLTYNQIFEKSSVIKNLPIMYEGRQLPKGMSAKVVLVRVQYDKYVESFEKEMQEVLKGLKKEGFDERMQLFQKMEDIDKRKAASETWKEGDTDSEGKVIEKPAMPSGEELNEAEKIRKDKAEFDKELSELNEEYMQARISKSSDEVEFNERKFTVDELSEIISMLGDENQMIEINKVEVSKGAFINMLGAKFCE